MIIMITNFKKMSLRLCLLGLFASITTNCICQAINNIEYFASPIGKTHISAVNSLRVQNNSIKKTSIYEVSYVHQNPIDTSLYKEIVHFKNGYTRSSLLKQKNLLNRKKPPLSESERESLIALQGNLDSLLNSQSNQVITESSGACKKTTWYNARGLPEKEKTLCGGIFTPAAGINSKKLYKYDDRNRLIEETFLSSNFRFWVNRMNWKAIYSYDDKDNLTEKIIYDKKDKVKSHYMYTYEYWD